jgi:hypothetical protein
VVRRRRISGGLGTAQGVLQAINTYEHREGVVRGSGRAERDPLRTITGGFPSLVHRRGAIIVRIGPC